MDDYIKFIIAILAAWRISVYLYADKKFKWLRDAAGCHIRNESNEPLSFLGRELSCFWCVSMWASVTSLLIFTPFWAILIPLGVSGAVMLLGGAGRDIWRMQNGP